MLSFRLSIHPTKKVIDPKKVLRKTVDIEQLMSDLGFDEV